MWNGNKTVQSHKMLHTHGTCSSRHKNMCNKFSKRSFLSVTISCALCNHIPEKGIHVVIYKALIFFVRIVIKSRSDDCLHNAVRLYIFDSTNNCHRSKHNFLCTGHAIVQLCHLASTLFTIEKLSVLLYQLTNCSRCRKSHLTHPDGIEVGTILFAILLHSNEPVIIRLCIGNRTVHHIIARLIIVAKQLFYCKIVCPSQFDECGIG